VTKPYIGASVLNNPIIHLFLRIYMVNETIHDAHLSAMLLQQTAQYTRRCGMMRSAATQKGVGSFHGCLNGGSEASFNGCLNRGSKGSFYGCLNGGTSEGGSFIPRKRHVPELLGLDSFFLEILRAVQEAPRGQPITKIGSNRDKPIELI
jgi:hypothetical protein